MQNTSCKLALHNASWFHQNNPVWETFSKIEYRSSDNNIWLVHEGVWSAGNTIKTLPETWNIETNNKSKQTGANTIKRKYLNQIECISTQNTDTSVNHRYDINSNMWAGRGVQYLPLLSWIFYSLLLLVCLRLLDFLHHDEARITADASYPIPKNIRAPLDEENIQVVWPTETMTDTLLKMILYYILHF